MTGQDAARAIRAQVPMREAAERYGLRPNRAGYIRCPFHNENTPSLKLYDHSWYCFGCQTGGDLITFVRKFFGFSFSDAVSRINNDFHLGLDLRPPRRGERQKPLRNAEVARIREQREREQKRTAFNAEIEHLTELCGVYYQCTRLYEPVRVSDTEWYINPCLEAAWRELPALEYQLEELERELANLDRLPAKKR